MRVYLNPPTGREVHIEFTDGTALAIEIDIAASVSGRYYRTNQGDIEVIQERRDPASEPSGT